MRESWVRNSVPALSATHEPGPSSEPYLRAAEQLGVDPASCVAVEDSPTGTASAVAAGCIVLVVPCEVPVEPGERRILRESLVGVDAEMLGTLAGGGRSPAAGSKGN
ncbi:MAG: HAD-IA family hydrolase [Pseudonocardiaceae bacterium]